MRLSRGFLAALFCLALPTLAQARDDIVVHNPGKANLNWMMNCQGCHGVRGQGSPGGAPDMSGGILTEFLKVPGGRTYLGSVPGVANAPINDAALADLMNWVLLRFTCEDLPQDFKPYEAADMAEYRKNILITNAEAVRVRLLEQMPDKTGTCSNNSR